MAPGSSPLSPLKIADFRALWMWLPLSNLGAVVQAVGAAWLMTSLTSSADMVALVQTATTLPLVIFSLAAGALSDNFDRRTIMLYAQVFMLVVSATLAVLAWFGGLTPWLLLGFTFLIGCGTTLNNPAWHSSVGDLVPKSHLAAAISLNAIAFNVTRTVGPAVGGVIVGAAGASAAFAFNTLSYVGLVVRLYLLKPFNAGSKLPREQLASAMTVGLHYVLLSPNIEAVLLRVFMFGFATIAVQALLPLVARDLLGGGPVVYGGLLGAFGLGGVAGGFIGHWLRERLSGEGVTRLNHIASAAATMALPLAPNVWVAGFLLMFCGAAWLLTYSHCNITVQMLTPRWVVGRALAAYHTAAFAGIALGSWVWGLVAEEYGVAASLVAAGVVTLLGAGGSVILRMPDIVPRNLDPLERRHEPKVAIALERRSGPVVIMIEYLIGEEDEAAFLTVMNERRLVRGRNGARNWSLMRDTENPMLWIETYHTPNWTEYLRHNERTTHADAEVTERIRALHRGDEPPKVHRLIMRPTWAVGSTPKPPPDIV